MSTSRRLFLKSAALISAFPLLARAGKLDETLSGKGAQIHFAVKIDNRPAGQHLIRFRAMQDHVRIDHEVDILVKVAFVTVYSLQHKSTEIWSSIGRESRLLSMESDTIEDGKEHLVTGKATADAFIVKTTREEIVAPLDIATTNSFWADAAVMRPHVIDSQDGSLIQSRLDEVTAIVENNVQKEHIRLHADDRTAEAWFHNDILMEGKMQRNGHTIYYNLA